MCTYLHENHIPSRGFKRREYYEPEEVKLFRKWPARFHMLFSNN